MLWRADSAWRPAGGIAREIVALAFYAARPMIAPAFYRRRKVAYNISCCKMWYGEARRLTHVCGRGR